MHDVACEFACAVAIGVNILKRVLLVNGRVQVNFFVLFSEGLHAKRAYIAFCVDFHFLQDRANF